MLPATQIIGLAKPLIEVPAKSLVARVRLPYQVSKVVKQQAKSRSIAIPGRQIRKIMKTQVIRDLTAGPTTDDSVKLAVTQLTWLMPGMTPEERRETSSTLVGLIFWGYLWVLSPAVAQSHMSLSNQIGDLRTAVSQEMARIDERVTFEENLSHFSPVLRELATHIHTQWPRIEKLARELSVPATRASIVEQWSNALPDWLRDCPGDVYAWLGLITSGSGDGMASFRFWDKAVRAGYYPIGLAVGYAARSLALTDPDRARVYIAEHPNDHPFTEVALAGINEDIPAFLAALERWQPEERFNASTKAFLAAAAHVDGDQAGQAITLAVNCWEEFRNAASALLAAHVLLARAQRFDSIGRVADAQQAVDLALSARDERRAYGGDSAEAVDFAVVGLVLLHNSERAWQLTQPPPQGEASQDEADDSRVRAHAGLAAAVTGRTLEARRLASDLDGFAHAHIEAVLAEWAGDNAGIRDAWTRAWASASNDVERLQAASGLVHAGELLPDLGTTRDAFPEPSATLDALAAANTSDDPTTYLRAKALTNPGILVELADRLADAQRFLDAAKALDEGAIRWSHPILAIMAARFYLQEVHWHDAAESSRRALTYGGPDWPGRKQAFSYIIEAEASRQHWADAAAAAEQLLSENPEDVEAQWALAIALYNDARPDKAWTTITRAGKPLRPRRQHEVIAWLRLVGRFDTRRSALDDAFELMRDWTEDEKVFGAFIQVLLSPTQLKVEVSDEQATRIQEAIAEFFAAYPDSNTGQSFQTGPDDNPLQPVAHIIRALAERGAEAQKLAAKGELPLGALGAAVNRTYAEASLRRAAGAVLADTFPRQDDEIAVGTLLSEATCVLDATSAHTLALVDDQLRVKLLGTPRALVILDATFRDALVASEALRSKSTLTVGWDANTDRPVASEISETQAQTLSDRADAVLQILGSILRVPHNTLENFPEFDNRSDFGDRALPWLGSVDLAKTKTYTLWSDDRTLRHLAAARGVRAVGTVELIDALLERGAVTEQERTVALATLISNFYVDLRFDRDIYQLALAISVSEPGPVANAMSRPAAWVDPAAAVEFALDVLGRTAGQDPLWLQAWCGAFTAGLLAVATGNAEMCSNNVAAFFSRCVAASWCTRSTVPFVLTGVRLAMTEAVDQPLRDPLEAALRQLHAAAVESLGHAGAKGYVLDFVSESSTEDKQTAARVILTAPR